MSFNSIIGEKVKEKIKFFFNELKEEYMRQGSLKEQELMALNANLY